MTPAHPHERLKVALVMLVVITVWGAAFSGIRVVLQELDPMTLTLARLCVNALAFFAFLPFAPKRKPIRASGDVPRLLIAGACGMAGYQLAINWGETRVTAGTASIIVASMPVIVAVMSVFFLKQRANFQEFAGVSLSFLGLLALGFATGRLGVGSIQGFLVTLTAPVFWAIYTIITKPLAARYDGVRIHLIGSLAGLAVVAPFGIAHIGDVANLSWQGWAWLLYLGIFSSAASYVAFAWCLGRASATEVSTFVNFVPIASLIAAFFLLGERPPLLSLLALAVVLAGVALVQVQGSRNTVEA